MMNRVRKLGPAFFVALALFIGSMLAITAYTIWRLHVEAVENGLAISALHSRSFEDFLTQSLHVTELAAMNAAPPEGDDADLHSIGRNFVTTLIHAPFLRSMSLLDDQGRITASSNPANVGVMVPTQGYLPPSTPAQEILRIGQPWAGRDFADGRPTTTQTPEASESVNFIPVTRTVMVGKHNVTLLIALNPDYFINHMSQTLAAENGSVEVLRYDGTLLLTTQTQERLGSLHDYIMRNFHLSAVESGKFEQNEGEAHKVLTAFRASHLYPFVVVTHLDREAALVQWQTEEKTLLAVVIPALLIISLLAGAFYSRQLQLSAQRVEAERLQRIHATVFDASTEAIIITDVHANIVSVNAAFTHITGFSATDVIGQNPRLMASGLQDKDFYQRMWQALLQDGVWYGELVNRHKDGTLYDARVSITASHDNEGRLQHFIGNIIDITQRKASAEKLRLAASVFAHSREGILITATDGTIIDVNDAFCNITGYPHDEVLGKTPRILGSGRQSKAFYTSMWSSLIHKGHWYGEVWNRRKNGEVYAEMLTISTVRDAHGEPQHYVALFSDISAIKAHQSQLEHIAHFDALTCLPNRVLLADRLRQAIAQTERRGQLLAVVYLDLDGFKSINDQHGHEAGDQLLVALATRMKEALREGDTIARIGGDEFVAVLLDLEDVAASVPMLNRLLEASSQAIHIGPHQLQVSASLGVTFYPQVENVDADMLLRQADQAMYQAKLAGRNRYHFFDAEQDRSIRGHHESVEHIRRALTDHEFVLYFQPKVNMRTGQVIGAEALIRWQHPDKGLLQPATFLPVIEDHQLAIDIGEWVIDAALTQIERWRLQGLDLPVSVNVGARQLQHSEFVSRLRLLLALHPQVKPNRLELEVLETSALEDVVGVSQLIDTCRELGVLFALDDFGTGYSSLTYLKRLRVNLLKIDQSFVRDMLDDPDDLAILDGVIGLATAFRREVIAEGVETIEHGTMLLQLGCEQAQGYGIARPMPGEDLPQWAAHWQPEPAWLHLPLVSRDDLPLLFASAEHRAWVLTVESFLKSQSQTPFHQDPRECRFGLWLSVEGLARHGAQPVFHTIEALHQQVHALAQELLALHAQGHRTLALSKLEELHALRDALLEQLKTLTSQAAP